MGGAMRMLYDTLAVVLAIPRAMNDEHLHQQSDHRFEVSPSVRNDMYQCSDRNSLLSDAVVDIELADQNEQQGSLPSVIYGGPPCDRRHCRNIRSALSACRRVAAS